jgi:hypothetical protein
MVADGAVLVAAWDVPTPRASQDSSPDKADVELDI